MIKYPFGYMRKLYPNLEKEDGLETILEVPLPQQMFTNIGNNASLRWQNMRNLMRAQRGNKPSFYSMFGAVNDQFILLLKLVAAPLIPFQFPLDHALTLPIRGGSIEASTAKYIVQQYIAATGGQGALNAVNSMYAVGEVKTVFSDMHQSNDSDNAKRSCEVGGFVLWQKNPDLWFLELVVSAFKVGAGCDGKVAWSQSSNANATKGPPRPLRRFFQGLDPRATANLFLNAVCIGEKTIEEEGCFVLRLEISADVLKAQSTPSTEIVHHTIWGYFSQRTGLLIQFEDTKLVRMKAAKGDDCVYWETSMESRVQGYKYVDGINIAHRGGTTATIYRYGRALNHRAKVEETWRIEEVDFNIVGLSLDYFLAPAEVQRGQGHEEQE